MTNRAAAIQRNFPDDCRSAGRSFVVRVNKAEPATKRPKEEHLMYISHQLMMAQHDEVLRRAARDREKAMVRRARAAHRRQARERTQPGAATGNRLVRALLARTAA
jgi:hypothetical protein